MCIRDSHQTGTPLTHVRFTSAARDFSQSTLSVQTLFRCPYSPRVQSHALTSTCKRKIPGNDSHTIVRHHHHHYQPLNREGRWGTTDNFATSFLHFSLFSTALWDLPNSRPVHFLMLSSLLFFCLPCLLPPFTVPCNMVLARPDERET